MRPTLAKPEYFFRPRQLAARLRLAVAGLPSAETTVRLPWGWPMRIDPKENIGRALVTLGIYDLVVSETLHRLLDPAETAADIGANVGSMTAVLARRAGAGGKVFAFEPHPELHRKLAANAASWPSEAEIAILPEALSDREGEAVLRVPENYSANSGLSSLSPSVEGRPVSVRATTLDAFFRDRPPPALIKLDVEGHEASVLWGGARLLEGGRVRDVLFEENSPSRSEARGILERAGYRIFLLQRGFWRPRLEAADGVAPTWEPPTFLATRDDARAKERLARWGWRVLR